MYTILDIRHASHKKVCLRLQHSQVSFSFGAILLQFKHLLGFRNSNCAREKRSDYQFEVERVNVVFLLPETRQFPGAVNACQMCNGCFLSPSSLEFEPAKKSSITIEILEIFIIQLLEST